MASRQDSTRTQGELRLSRPAEETLLVRLLGHWSLQGGMPSIADVRSQVDAEPRPQRLALHPGTHELGQRPADGPARHCGPVRSAPHRPGPGGLAGGAAAPAGSRRRRAGADGGKPGGAAGVHTGADRRADHGVGGLGRRDARFYRRRVPGLCQVVARAGALPRLRPHLAPAGMWGAGPAHRHARQLSCGRHSGLHGLGAAATVRGADLHRRPGGVGHGPGAGSQDDGHHHGQAHRRRLRSSAPCG